MRLLFLFAFCLFTGIIQSQPYVLVEEVGKMQETGLHSGVGLSVNDEWLFIGGRINGLHGFRPPLAFESNGVNNEVTVVDWKQEKVWSRSMKDLPEAIREPLTSSNMQYVLSGDQLVMVGGYGWKESEEDFVTFNTLITVDVNLLMTAIKEEKDWPEFHVVRDSRFEVTGGHLIATGDTLNLVFGHRFFGRYSRNSKSQFFEQEYTNEIRRFSLKGEGETLTASFHEALRDTANYHRRDYNLVPQMGEKGRAIYTAFSGVFRYEANLPFYTPVQIEGQAVKHIVSFEQRYAHYHSAVLPVWDSETQEMHSFFFGGMAEYYQDSATGKEVQDTMVPFVKSISHVVRKKDGSYTEKLLSATMPGYLGTNMWFFPKSTYLHSKGHFIDKSLVEGKTLVGHLVGGIVSPYENISVVDASISGPNRKVFAVYLSDKPLSMAADTHDPSSLDFSIFPNPSSGQVFIEAGTKSGDRFRVEILSASGKMLKAWDGEGGKTLVWMPGDIRKGTYIIRMTTGGLSKEKQLVWK